MQYRKRISHPLVALAYNVKMWSTVLHLLRKASQDRAISLGGKQAPLLASTTAPPEHGGQTCCIQGKPWRDGITRKIVTPHTNLAIEEQAGPAKTKGNRNAKLCGGKT
jgi:hypothetical protein